ncbi:MAG: ATPase/protein kinase family protein [Myxococcales bacterium]|nr:ATPase/protein kinase family protein [Myxococcales bacterium]
MIEETATSSRYQVVRRIGAGGMGVVYEAEDKERGQKVALKTISNPDVEKVYQLKREFRVLADLSHPNLVALYDLVVDETSCFFTMELLDGQDLLTHLSRRNAGELAFAKTGQRAPADVTPAGIPLSVAPQDQLVSSDVETVRSVATARGTDPSLPQPALPNAPTERTPFTSSCDFARLRAALPQLAQGLAALHAAGKIHRDVKPSNIIVTTDGRVVLLDFGLVAELERRRGDETGMIVGTVGYMAPEQCAGDVPLTPAADWYALGVVLFQAMTGKLPFEGPAARVLLEKQTKEAPRPSMLVRGVPTDLDELCCELLEREPTGRPSGRALLQRLGLAVDDPSRPLRPSYSHGGGFTGRDQELAELEAALVPLARRRASVVVVRAPSGMGKSALIARFFERVRATHEDAVLLRGRCLEREDVPYKAIDDLIDELSDWWREQTPTESQALLPRDACMLPTLFPVLGRVAAIADAPRTRQVIDPQARRTHAFEALREALQRLADRHTLVLFLDDMQWVDRDTTTLLADVMRAPDPPPLLLVLATRTESTPGSRGIAASEPVLDLVKRMDAEQTVIEVGALPEEVAVSLAVSQLTDGNEQVARRLVQEAAGSPFFLIELTRYLQGRSLAEIAGKGLDAMLSERIDELGETARLIAEMIAVAGEPLTRRSLVGATAIPSAELTRQLSVLRAQRVLRASGSRNDDTIEPYHDRVREAVIRSVPVERRARHHRALAIAMSGQGTADQLARHWHGAGDLENAAMHAKRAGEEARAKLDFDLSARWYAIALEGPQWSDDERRQLRTQLADALADAGRPRDAADQFMIAAHGAESAVTLELNRRAAGSLLQSGYVTEGLELTRIVLAGVGLTMPSTPGRALVSMLARRAWLRIRGLGFRPRALAQIGQAELTRVDVCEGVAFGLALVDTFRSMDFGVRFLGSALRLGEVWRISRALALEADFLAVTAKYKRAQKLLDQLEQLTPTLDSGQAEAQLMTTRGLFDFFIHNRFRSSLDQLTDAITKYRAVVGRAGFELDTVSIFCCWSLYYMGEIGELSKRVPAMAEAAVRNGNRYTAVTLRCAFPVAWLARLDPETVEAEIDRALGSWTTVDGTFQVQHLLALCSRIDLALYRGRPEDVNARIASDWKPMRRALIDRPPMQALLLRSTLGRHALACAAAAPKGSTRQREALAAAREQVRKSRRTRLPLMTVSAQLLDGSIAAIEGRTDQAVAHYRSAIVGLDERETVLFANAARARLGRVIGGDEGKTLVTTARTWLTDHGVRDPDKMLDMLLPGPR